MRLSEAAGLMLNDLCLDEEVPHIVIHPHKHRPLKTRSSERIVPLINAGSASASINKWLKTVTGKNYVCHGFRHALRDKLCQCLLEPTLGVHCAQRLGGKMAIRLRLMAYLEG